MTAEDAMPSARLITRFPEIIAEAARRNEPYLITRFTVELAQAFNKYYFEHRILGDDAAAQNARLLLTDAVRICLNRGLYLIGVQAPRKM